MLPDTFTGFDVALLAGLLYTIRWALTRHKEV